MDQIENFYEHYDEEDRLGLRDGYVEYMTSMKYIREYLGSGKKRILDLGAGTGRYSFALSNEGHIVDALEYTNCNVSTMRSKMKEEDSIILYHGTALDLSKLEDNVYDITLIFGPMYHLFEKSEKIKVLEEAIRVTKEGGYIFAAYCMNDATVIQSAFRKGKIKDCIKDKTISDDFTYIRKNVFSLVRKEDIDELDTAFSNIVREKIIATDGAACYMSDCLNKMDDETYNLFLKYHFSVCERPDLLGASNHCLDILKKVRLS